MPKKNLERLEMRTAIKGVGDQLSAFPDLTDPKIASAYNPSATVTIWKGDRLELLKQIGDAEAQLIATSPPYNIGKAYESRKEMETYLREQEDTIAECVRVLHPKGSICWQVGNHVREGEVYPLDTLLYPIFKKLGLQMRNRIIWHFEHGLHASRRFSGRHETIIWFTKSDKYIFNLDRVRIPQKYPGKRAYKGPRAGQLSGNPLGKNPGDVWIIPNVKNNHPEKTSHPCQFPVELIQRLIRALTNKDDLVVDPYMGVGTTAVASLIEERRSAGADTVEEYVRIARRRVILASQGRLPLRPVERPVYQPSPNSRLVRNQWIRDA